MMRPALLAALSTLAASLPACEDDSAGPASAASAALSAAPTASAKARASAEAPAAADEALKPYGDGWYCVGRCYREADACRDAEGQDCEQRDRAYCATSAKEKVARCFARPGDCEGSDERAALQLSVCTEWK